jgi:TRAP transporter 4TM/12TM fusion protein
VYALLPALLYFASIFIAVDIRAAKLGLKPVTDEEAAIQKRLVLSYCHFFLSPVALIYFLAVAKVSLQRGAFWSVATAVLLSLIRKDTRLTPGKFVDAMERGITSAMPVAAACACAGIILGVINMTGLGLHLSGILVELGGGSIFVTLVLTMITSLILGMGLPTTACYIILSIIAAPALIQMGVPALSAHMFIFYFGTLSTLTPPIALAAYAAAGIAGAPQFKTAITAVRLALPAFIAPYLFVYSPSILLQGSWQSIVYDAFRCLVAFSALACGFERRVFDQMHISLGILLIVAAFMLVVPQRSSHVIGFLIVATVYSINYLISRKKSSAAGTSDWKSQNPR